MTEIPHLIDHCLGLLWAGRGSDLLLIANSAPLLRIDGELKPVAGEAVLDPADTAALAERLLPPGLAERFLLDRQVDFSFTWQNQARMRVNAYTQKGGVALAMRMIPVRIPEVNDLGLPRAVERWLRLPRGFVLVTGPTGSGKSTSLAAMVHYINTHRALHIITIEDPIEYVHEHRRSAISQREVGTDTNSFADAMRACLREDPDVLLIGEMRDPESIQAALTIAETGHLVFASLHTNDAGQTLDRIIDVFPAEKQPQIRLQLAHTLAGILHQVLVPRIGGGRVAAFDVLIGTPAVSNIIREGKTRQVRNAIATGRADGMQTLETSLSDLIAQGVVDYQEATQCSLYPGEIVRPGVPPLVEAGSGRRRDR